MKFLSSRVKAEKIITAEGRDVALKFIVIASMMLGIAAAATFYYFHLVVGLPGSGVGYVGVTVIMLFFIFLAYLLQFGYRTFVAYALILTYILPTAWLLTSAGFDLPQGILMCALVICLINILLPSRGVWWAVAVLVGYLVIVGLELENILQPRRDWHEHLYLSDGIVFVGTLSVIVVIAWLFNREIERSLRRALTSEKRLKEERDLLEERVEERTAELKRSQFERVLQVQRFTDVGRHASGLFHDLVNPLTSLNLHIEHLYNQTKEGDTKQLEEITIAAQNALGATKRIEQFVTAARRQISQQEIDTQFSPAEEVQQILLASAYRLRLHKIKTITDIPEGLVLYGNPVKFYRVIQNLVANSIDAYEENDGIARREILIRFHTEKQRYVLEVQDYAGGIIESDHKRIFQPFYTTKSLEKGTGIGLTIVRDLVEHDFAGKIELKSQRGEGTHFTITIPVRTFALKTHAPQ